MLVSSTFGLRPIECAQIKEVKLRDGYIGLKIKNAKHSHGRSFGKCRTIWFSADDEQSDEFEAFRASSRLTLLFDKKSKIEADRWLKGARNFLNQLYATNSDLKKLAIKHRITLYSARHQFSANAKKAGIPASEIAAMMGHRSDETHVKSYGKRRVGKGGFGIKADPFDVERVKEKMQSKQDGPSPHQLGR